MKVFYTENGKEVVFVQLTDILFLTAPNGIHRLTVPISVYSKASRAVADLKNKTDFIKFSFEPEVQYFKDASFIIDYKEYEDKTCEKMETLQKEMIERVSKIADEWNGMDKDLRKESLHVYKDYINEKHRLEDIQLICMLKSNKIQIEFPDFMNL